MKHEFFGPSDRYESDDFSAQNIIDYISQMAPGRAWTHKKMQDVCEKATHQLEKSYKAGDSLDVFAQVGENDIHMECEGDDNLMPCSYGDNDAILWGRITDFDVKKICETSSDIIAALCVRVEAYDELEGHGTYWLPIAKAGSYGIELEIVGAPDMTSVDEGYDVPEIEAMSETSAEFWGYWDIAAESILTANRENTSQEATESIQRMYNQGVIPDLDLFSTVMNMVISEGLKEGDTFTADFTGVLERMDANGTWLEQFVEQEEIFDIVGMEFSADMSVPGGVRSYAYMGDAINNIVRAAMDDNNFLIEHVVSDVTEDVE